MPVSDLAIYSGARAVGFLANALFVGPSPKRRFNPVSNAVQGAIFTSPASSSRT